MAGLTPIPDDHFRDHCGLFGIYGHPEAARLTYLGLYAQQHRGQESAGIVASDGQKLRLEKAMGLVNDVFDDARLDLLTGDRAMGHVRYSTAGDTVTANAQPILIDCHRGPIASPTATSNARSCATSSRPPARSSSARPTPRSSSTCTQPSRALEDAIAASLSR
jgi:amidophosphoribosyltransferase